MSGYREAPPHPALAGTVACTWVGVVDDLVGYTDRVLPDACVDIVWDGERLFVAGPDTGPVPLEPRLGQTFVGIRFRPGCAPVHLGLPAAALLDQRVPLAQVWGAPAAELAERLAAASGPAAASLVLERILLARLPDAPAADPLVDPLLTALAGGMPVRVLADRLGISERQLHRRCTAAVGYGPKVLHRVLRFRRALALAGSARGLAELAAGAGYADQAHLSRECRRLAGQTPSDLFKTAASPAL